MFMTHTSNMLFICCLVSFSMCAFIVHCSFNHSALNAIDATLNEEKIQLYHLYTMWNASLLTQIKLQQMWQQHQNRQTSINESLHIEYVKELLFGFNFFFFIFYIFFFGLCHFLPSRSILLLKVKHSEQRNWWFMCMFVDTMFSAWMIPLYLVSEWLIHQLWVLTWQQYQTLCIIHKWMFTWLKLVIYFCIQNICHISYIHIHIYINHL